MNCNRPNHFAAACRQNSSANGLLAHMNAYNNGQFSSASQLLEIPAKLTPDVINSEPVTIDIFPDSGANICLAGPKQLAELHLDSNHLRPCNKKVRTVGDGQLVCAGWIPIKFEINEHTTVQPVYFCKHVDKLYFSKQGCLDMNILPKMYPMPMSVKSLEHVDIDNKKIDRTSPPPPKVLPYPPTPENIPMLKQYIIDSFNTSAFNNSDVPFPALSAPPFKLHLKPNAIPFAQHTPIPIAHHHKPLVKAQLDRDVERGIIIPVPVNTPVRWCAPMVVVTKPDGSPRRTIDYQKLNSQCSRQTHYTHSCYEKGVCT